jgi:uncharacterized iron-regulated membrane protein
VAIVCITGAVVWWPGVNRWRRSLYFKSRSGWRRLTWDLHSAMGAWLFPFIFMWAVTGFYLGAPESFTAFVDYISDPNPELLGDRPGDVILLWLSRLHFGRWQSDSLKALWAVVGLSPAIMFVTGAVMWWNRVVRKRPARSVAESPLTEPLV